MTKISSPDVTHLAALSNLSLDEQDMEQLQADLANIVNYISELHELDTTGVEPTYQVTGLEDIGREDKIVDYGVTREALLDDAPEQKDKQIKVPKVL